ncbi:hypothetical protein [Nocardia suismassiliense]|uniref:hypothetical protein n=1 Tax=Nocardia suismassiliense TaxID=2077092 RepID=UPI00131F0277|nr:hypothetical protein [Nocardia suismassiliense]
MVQPLPHVTGTIVVKAGVKTLSMTVPSLNPGGAPGAQDATDRAAAPRSSAAGIHVSRRIRSGGHFEKAMVVLQERGCAATGLPSPLVIERDLAAEAVSDARGLDGINLEQLGEGRMRLSVAHVMTIVAAQTG